MKKEDQAYAQELAAMAKKHSSEAFYALDDPLEAAVFSALIELMKKRRSALDDPLEAAVFSALIELMKKGDVKGEAKKNPDCSGR